MIGDSTSCPDHHRVLRLSLTKHKQKKIFLKCKKEIEKDIGSSKRNWFEDLTLCIVPGNKCKKDVLTSPVTQDDLTFSKTPDLIKQQYELTPGSSALLSVGHILDSQGATPSPLRGWSPPLLGLSPVSSTQEGEDNLCQDAVSCHEANLMKSLGISPNDSSMSWTSSLATPCTLRLPLSDSSCDGDSRRSKGHVKGLPRVLFSPDPSLNIMESKQEDTIDDSSHGLTEDNMKKDYNRTSCFSGREEQCSEVNKELENKVIKKEYIRNDDLDSMPLFSQDLLSSQVVNLSQQESWNVENYQIMKPSDQTAVGVKEEDQMMKLSDLTAVGVVKEEDQMMKPSDQTAVCVKEEDQIMKPSDLTAVSDVIEEIKAEVVSDTLSDFFDPPSKSVGRRRCAPNRGKKRKSEELSWNDSVFMDNLCSTPKEAVPIRSILSSEKRKNSQERTRKRVRFSEDGDDVKLFVRSSGTYSEDKMDNSSSKFKGTAINENESYSAVFMPDKSTSVLEEHTSSNQDKVSTIVTSVDTESSNLSDRDEDLFSQVSPSALSEMCSVAFAEDKDNLRRLPSDLRTKKCEPEDTARKEKSHMNDPLSTEAKTTGRSHDSSALMEEKLYLTGQIHEGKYNNSTTVLGSAVSEAKKETCDSNITDDVSKIPLRKSLSLKQKPRKFYYPTKKQIITSHQEFVYEFPNKVTVEVPKQNDIQSSTARNPDDRILLSEKIVTNGFREMSNSNDFREVSNSNSVKEKRNSNGVKETSNSNGVKEMSKSNGVREISNSNGVREMSNSNGITEMINSNGITEISNNNGVREMSNMNCVREMSNINSVTEMSNINSVTEMSNSNGFREMNNRNGVREMSNSYGIGENSTTLRTKFDSKADILGFQRFSSLRNQGNNTDVFDDDNQGIQLTDQVKSQSDCDSIPVHQQLREDNSKLSRRSVVSYKTIEQSEYTKSEVLAQSVHNISNQNTESLCQENTEDDNHVVVSTNNDRRENTGSIKRVLDNSEDNEYNKNMGTPHNNDTHPSSASVMSTKTSCDHSSASIMSTKTSCDPSSASVMSTKTSCDPSSASVMSTKTSCDTSSASAMSTKTSCDPSSASVMSTKTSCNLSYSKNALLTKSLDTIHDEPNSTGFQNAKAANKPLCHQNKVPEQKLDSLLPNQWITTISGKSAKVSHFGSYQKKRKDLFADIFEELGNIDEMPPGHKLTSNITGFMSASGKDFKSEKLYEKPGMKNVGKVSPKTGNVKNLFSDIFDEFADLGMKSGENQPQDGFISFKTASGKDLKSGSFLLNSSELVSKKCSADKGKDLRVLDKYPQQGSNEESPESLNFKMTNRTREKPLLGVKGANIFADIFEEYSEDAKIPDLMSETAEGLSGFRSAGGKEMSSNFHTVIKCEESSVDKGIEHTDITTGAGPKKCLSKRTSSGQLKTANLFCDIFEELGQPGIDVSDPSGNESSFVGFKSAAGEELKAGFISVKNAEANSVTCMANSFPSTNVISVKNVEANSVTCMADSFPSTNVSSEFKGPVPLKNVTNVKSSRQQEMKSATLAAKFAGGSNIPKGFRPFKPPKILKGKAPGKDLSNDAKERSGSMDQQASMIVIKQDNLPTEEKIENLFMEEMFIDELEPSQRFSPDSGRPVKKAKYETDKQSSSVMLSETEVTDEKRPESETISKVVNKQVSNEQSSSSTSRPVKMETPILSTSDRVDIKENWNVSTCDVEVSTTQRKESSDSDFGEEFYNVNEIEMLEKHYIDNRGTECQTVSGNSKVSKSFKGTDSKVRGEEKSVESREEGTTDDLLISDKADCYRQQRNNGEVMSFGCGFTTAGGNKVEGPSRKSLEAACRMMAVTDEDIITMPIDEEKTDVSYRGSVWKQKLFDELTKPFSQLMGKEVCKDNVTCDEFSTVCGDGQSTDAERVDISSCDKDVTEGHNMNCGDPSGTVTARGETNKTKNSKVEESALKSGQHVDQNVSNVQENIDDMEKDTYKGVLEAEVCSDRFKREDVVCKPDIKTNTGTVTVSKLGNDNPSDKCYVCTDAVEHHSVTKAKLSENICNSTSGEMISLPFQSASGKAITIRANSLQAAQSKTKDSELPTLNVQSRFDKISDVITTSLSPERKSSENDKETRYCPFQSASGKVITVSTDAAQAARKSLGDDQNFVSSPFHSASGGRLINVSVNSILTARKTLESDQELTVNSPFQSASGRNISISESSLKAARKTLESDQELTVNSPFQSASGRNISISESSLKAARKTLESDQELTVNSPFQSASGRNISISESSLKAARKTLESDQELTVNSPFQSASGRNISISESSLKAARKTLESDQELTVNSPFQSASGRNISISESSLKAARKTLESDQELTVNSPFQSASGRNISISESSLKAARKTLESDQELTVNSPFQSASGRNISISESSLKAASKTLESDQELTVNSPFQSASGRNISISESSLKAARKTLESDQELTVNSPFQSASGRNISISESSLKAASKTLESDQELTVNSPFQSASGRNISISESSLKAARKTLESDQELTVNSPFQSASGRNISISESSLKAARKTLESDQELTVNSPFQSASGRNISISESSLKAARKTLESDQELTVNSPFQSASGRNISISESSLKAARKTLESDQELTVNSPFQSASGRNISISESSLKAARKTLESDQELTVNSPFQSASGRNISISESSLKAARKTVESDQELTVNSPFQSASGRNISISESSLKAARKTLESDQELTVNSPFQSASGRNISISESSLKAARKTLESDQELTMNSPFQSASGRNISISESSLKAARKTLESDQELTMNSPFQSASGRNISISESSLKAARKTLESDQELTVNSPFQSASGRNISISESSLRAASKTLESDQELTVNSPFQSASVRNISISESSLKAARKTLESDQELTVNSPFQSASGRNISISESSLKAARKTLESDQELTMNSSLQSASGRNISISESSLKAARKTLESDQELTMNSSLQSASGRNISISESSLRTASKTLESEEGTICLPLQVASDKTVDTSSKPLSTTRKTLENGKEAINSPFQSASGRTVSVSSDSLLAARKALKSDHEAISSLFQSASGKAVNVSSNSLHAARKMWDRNDENCMLSSNTVACVTSHSLPSKQRTISNVQEEQAQEITVMAENSENSQSSQHHSSRGIATQGDKGREPPGFDDFVMAGDFDEEMETPHDPEVKNKDDRLGIRPFATDPEKFTMDRRVTSVSYSPLQCRNLRQNLKINPSSGQTPEVSTVYQGSSSFKTPYKDANSAAPDANIKPQNTDIKPKTPVFGVKPRQVSVSKDKSVPVCNTDQILPVQHYKTDLVHNIGGTNVHEVIDKDRCEKHNEKIDIPALCEARKKQSDMIEARSKVKVRPVEGILYRMKCNKQRSKLRDLFDMTRTSFKKNQKSSSLELAQGVTAGNAAKFIFRLADYYGVNVTSVYLGDGAFVVPDDRGNVGHSELYQGFLTANGVDKKLISREWFINHYRWIIWKLAAYERMSTKHMAKWALTPENVMLQMKYRYDREVDKCHRSAIKKISEKDDTACKRMVLLVSGIGKNGNSKAESTDTTSNLDSKVSVELSDGWYSIPTTVDIPLSHLIQQGRIREGHKLCISGAEMTECQDACSPLEMPAGLSLNICTNSTRPADWDYRLGYHKDPRPLCVPLCTLYSEGGSIGCVDVVLLRKYPVMYMEKFPDGGCVIRSAQAEEKYQQQYQRSQQDQMEKMYSKMEKTFEDGEEDENCITKKRWTKKEVEHLQTGHEIYEAYKTTRQPDIFEGYLREGQMTMLIEYRRQLLEERRHKLQSEFKKAWADNEKNFKRNVVPLIKLRVLGCSRKDLDTKKSTLVTVWRPEQDIEHLKEGTRYKVYGLTASTARSRYTESPVQLTASRHTRFQSLPLDENVLDMIYEPRRLQCVIDLRSGTAPYGESDIIGVVIEVDHTEFTESGKIQDIVYCADCNRDVFGVKFWGGIKAINSCDTLTPGKVVCFSNLIDRSSYRSSILPVLEWSSEFSLSTQSPQRPDQRGVVRELQEMVKAAGSCGKFLEDCGRILEEALHRNQETKSAVTPQKQNPLPIPESSTPVPEERSERMRKHKLLYQSKMSHLMAYGTPTSLSPITSPMPKSVRKEFVPPKLCRKDL